MSRISNMLQAICMMAVGNSLANSEAERVGHVDFSNGVGRSNGTHSCNDSSRGRGPGGMCRSKHHGKIKSRRGTRS